VSRIVTMRLDDEAYSELSEAAKAESRPLSNLIATSALERVRERQFVDGAEMAEILQDQKLVTRLRKGSRQARQRRGRFVG
jgi:hypothetical protein